MKPTHGKITLVTTVVFFVYRPGGAHAIICELAYAGVEESGNKKVRLRKK